MLGFGGNTATKAGLIIRPQPNLQALLSFGIRREQVGGREKTAKA